MEERIDIGLRERIDGSQEGVGLRHLGLQLQTGQALIDGGGDRRERGADE